MLGVGSGEVHANSALTFTFRTGTKAGLSQRKIKTETKATTTTTKRESNKERLRNEHPLPTCFQMKKLSQNGEGGEGSAVWLRTQN